MPAALLRLATLFSLVLAAACLGQGPAAAQSTKGPGFTPQEIVDAGNGFFGDVTTGLASVIERAAVNYGQPNGYILGQEGGGAFFGGLRYGEGMLHTRNAGKHKVYWQGPSLGVDVGADGARTMILVYNLPSVDALFGRFSGANGSAYFIGGFGLTALNRGDITLAPVRTGLGARLGLNLGYLKFTREPTWNPF